MDDTTAGGSMAAGSTTNGATAGMASSEARTAGLACALAGAELADRREEATRTLFAHVVEVRELEDGYAYRLPSAEPWAERALAFVAAERRCCPFFAFELAFEPDGGPLWLRVRGSAAVKAFVRELLEAPALVATEGTHVMDAAAER